MSDLTLVLCVAGGSLCCLVMVIWLISKLAPDLNPQKKKPAGVQPSPQPVAVIPTAAPATNPTAPAAQATANVGHDPRLVALVASIIGIVALAFLASTWLPNSHVIETTRELGLGTILIASVAALVAWNWGGKAGRTVAILLALIAGYKLLAVNSLLSLPPGAIWLIALAIGIVLLFLQNKNATRLGWIVLVLSFVFWMISPQGPSWPASWASRSSSAQAATATVGVDKIVLEAGKPVTIIVPAAPAWSPLITTTPRLLEETKFHSRITDNVWMWRPKVSNRLIECSPNARFHLTYSSVSDFERRYQVARGQEPTAIVVWIE